MKPTLVILAAGMGSRYGGLKQVDAVGSNGEAIIDFTVYDAILAGFKKVIFIIRKEHEEIFETNIASKMRSKIEVAYAYQDLNNIPSGITIPSERVKPWGTTHALLACKGLIDEDPFIICNADDFYGRDAFKKVMAFFNESVKADEYCMCGYKLANTMSDYGTVTRGFCNAKDGYLTDIKEMTNIKKVNDKAYVDDQEVSTDTITSMNFWGLKPSIFNKLDILFANNIEEGIKNNPLKYEALLPNDIGTLVKNNECKVKVLSSDDAWFGVTYKEDKPNVVSRIQKYKDDGLYPFDLWK